MDSFFLVVFLAVGSFRADFLGLARVGDETGLVCVLSVVRERRSVSDISRIVTYWTRDQHIF